MPTRKSFLAAAAALPILAASPAPAPAPTPTPKAKPPSDLARAFAERMRAFDPALSEKELTDIARGVDDNLRLGLRVNPKGRALKNWDEPVAVFDVPE